MQINLKFGKSEYPLHVPDKQVRVLHQRPAPKGPGGDDAVADALAHPIDSNRLRDTVRPGEKVAIITSDITRPMPTRQVLPLVLDDLEAGGVSMDDITVVFALGSHRPHTEAEKQTLAGTAYGRIRCVDSDPDRGVHLGVTSRGTPVDLFAGVVDADRRICLGNIEYHYFAGYSGGMKAVMPGVSTRASIEHNHGFMLDPHARTGVLDGNPVREDIEEIARFLPVDFIVNVILDEKKHILHAVAGHPVAAHRAGCRYLDGLYKAPLPAPADIVVVSAGGYPKDINLYQAQKALDNASAAVRDGGILILVASCLEGLGEGVFEQWMMESASPDELIDHIRQRFVLGGHKAAAIGQVLRRAEIYLVSDLPDETARSCFFTPFTTPQQAVDAAIARMGSSADIVVIPQGGSILPVAETTSIK